MWYNCSMENFLVVERAYGNGSWSLYRGRDRIFAASFGAGLPRAPEWFADVVAGLASVGVSPQSLDAVLAGTGPGSFSGIRSVIAALQGLALPRAIPVLGLSSAAALARATALACGARTVAVVGDARRGTLWSLVCDVSSAGDLAYRAPSVPSSQPPVSCSTLQPFNLSPPAELSAAIPPGSLIVSPERARTLREGLDPGICAVGVFVREDPEGKRFALDGLETENDAFPAGANPADSLEAWETGEIRDGVFVPDMVFRRSFRYPSLTLSLKEDPAKIRAVMTTDAAGKRRAFARPEEAGED